MTTAETINRLHERFKWPAPTNVDCRCEAVWCNLGYRRYVVFTTLKVLELKDESVVQTNHSQWVEGILNR